jgi:hypothetical protein
MMARVGDCLVFSPRDIQFYSIDSLTQINNSHAWKYIPSLYGISQGHGNSIKYLADEPIMSVCAKPLVCPYINPLGTGVKLLPGFTDHNILGMRESLDTTTIVFSDKPKNISKDINIEIQHQDRKDEFSFPFSELNKSDGYRQSYRHYTCKILYVSDYAVLHFPGTDFLFEINLTTHRAVFSGSLSDRLHVPQSNLIIPGYICSSDSMVYYLANDYAKIGEQVEHSSHTRDHGLKSGKLYQVALLSDGEFGKPQRICEIAYTGEGSAMEYYEGYVLIKTQPGGFTTVPVSKYAAGK